MFIVKDFRNIGGSILLRIYESSLYLILKECYPDYHFQAWKFHDPPPKKCWDNIDFQREFIKWAENKLNVKETSDWYTINWKVTI